MKYLPANKLVAEVKDAMLGALVSYTYHCFISDLGVSDKYTSLHQKEAWTQFYTLYSIAVGSVSQYIFRSTYLDDREELLKVSYKVFSNRESMTLRDWEVFNSFSAWMCKGTNFTPDIVLKRVHVSQYSYSLKEKNVWKDEYNYPRTA